MNLRVRENPWRLMLAVNAAVLIGVFLYKLTREPYVPYIHLLVDYHFGFTKRALIGALVSLFTAKVPVWLVFALSGSVWLVTAALFIALFRRTFGFDEEHLPLLVFMAGSPFFLKNFMYTLGHFDIYGCLFAIGLLLVPARSVVFVLLAALASVILVLVHHIHLLMYVPTIAVIVLLRYYLVQGFNRQNVSVGIAAGVCVGLLFLGALAFQHPRHSRVCAADLAAHPALEIFYQSNPKADGAYAPARRHCLACRGERGLSDDVRNGVRLFAMDLELGGLHVPDPACGENPPPAPQPAPPIPTRDPKTTLFGWIVTLVPRVGIVRPF